MKKIIKSRIFLVIITMIICISGTLYAANTYKASDVIYNASDGTSMNVNDALNNLYSVKKISNIKYVDITIPNAVYSYTINITDYIKEKSEIISAGAISRNYYGWTGLDISYNKEKVVISFGVDTGNNNIPIKSSGNFVVRVWYI